MVYEATFERLRRVAERLFADRPVLFAYHFGPAARKLQAPTGEHGAEPKGAPAARSGGAAPGNRPWPTNIDVAVYVDPSVPSERLFPEGSLRLGERLAEMPGEGVNILVLNRAPLLAQWRVIQEGTVLYSRDEQARKEFESNTRRRHEEHENDVRPLALRMLSDLADGS
jgi:hypothetical protein